MHGMFVRTITAFFFLLVLFPCSTFGEWAFFAMVAVFAVCSFYEMLKAPGPKKYSIVLSIVTFLFCISFVFWNFFHDWIGGSNPTNGGRFALSEIYVSLMAIICYGLVLFTFAIISPKVQLQDVTYLFTVGLLLAMGWLGVYFLRYFPNATGIFLHSDLVTYPEWAHGNPIKASEYFSSYYQSLSYDQNLSSCLLFFFVVLETELSDVGAYFFGMLFGKHKMNPRISPHKTWEGFFGGMFFAPAIMLPFAAIMEYCFKLPLVPGVLQFQHSALLESVHFLNGAAWPMLVLIGLLIPAIGNIGGFLFSLIKRHYGIKDYGKILPGHGGVIDRFDSTLINSICTSLLLILISTGFNLFG